MYLRLEFPHWGTATNTGTPQGTTIYAGSSTDWTSLPNVTPTFGFDNLNRLVSASEDSNWAQSYNYNQYGNMWMPSSTLPAPALGPVAPASNVYNPANNKNVYSTYDARGNLTMFGSVALSYDAENRQTAAGVNSYSYDGAGRRVSKTTGSGQTAFVYDAFGQLAAEYAGGRSARGVRHGEPRICGQHGHPRARSWRRVPIREFSRDSSFHYPVEWQGPTPNVDPE